MRSAEMRGPLRPTTATTPIIHEAHPFDMLRVGEEHEVYRLGLRPQRQRRCVSADFAGCADMRLVTTTAEISKDTKILEE
jgi:hypothetical protein